MSGINKQIPTYQTQPVNMGMSGQTGAPMQGNYGRGMQNQMGGQGIAGLPRMPVSAGQPYQPQGGMPQGGAGTYQGDPRMMQGQFQYGAPRTAQYIQQLQAQESAQQGANFGQGAEYGLE